MPTLENNSIKGAYSTNQPEQSNKEPSFKRKWWVLISIGVGTFMTALDTSIVNTILPIIKQSFNSSIDTVEWVVVIYLLFVSGLLPTFGRLGDIKGHKPYYLLGFAAFIICSLLCALSPSIYFLIAARAIQAIAAAMLSANSPAILTKSFPDRQRGQALGLQATMTYLGLTVGPALGGWLTDLISWRAVFFINLPVGLLAFTLSAIFVARELPGKTKEGFDIPGAATFMIGLIILMLGLNQGHNWGWFSALTISTIFTSILFIGIFILIELKSKSPMLDLKLFINTQFSTSIAGAILNYICVYSSIFLMPFYLIQGRNLTPSQTGLFLTTQPIVMAIIAPISGTLSDRLGTRLPTTLGMSISAVGLYFLSHINSHTTNLYLIISLAIFGLGIGIFISPNNSALMGSAPTNRQGIAAGLLATARNVGMVLGVGLASAIFNTMLSHQGVQNNSTLFEGIRISYLASFAVAIIGTIISALRSKPA